MSYITLDKQYSTALASCSPKIVAFLKGLADENGLINSDLLISRGFQKPFFTVSESIRSMSTQVSDYKKGRDVKVSKHYAVVGAKFPFKGTQYILDTETITDASKVVTYTFGGKSRHNYGLAVDIIPTKTRWKTQVDWGNLGKIDVKELFRRSGIVDLAQQCGLSWGGKWSDLYDPWHFEDTSYALPPKDDWTYNYDDNMTFDFIKRYNSGEFGTGEVKKAGLGFASKALFLALLGAFGYKFLLKGGKK